MAEPSTKTFTSTPHPIDAWRGSPEDMRRDVSLARHRVANRQIGGESTHALVEAETRERFSRCGTEHMTLGIPHAVGLDEAPKDTCGLLPQRTVAPLVALPV